MKTFVVNCYHSIEVDSYQNGELENVNNFDTKGEYETETPIEAIEKHLYSLGYNFDKNYIDTDEEENKIFYSVLCDEENDEATESQIEDWKKDEKILYANNMVIYVYELVSTKI